MRNTVYMPIRQIHKRRNNPLRMLINGKSIVIAIIVLIAIVFAGIYYYQATRFNQNIKINGTKVGGLTADHTLKKLQSTVLKNEVFIGEDRIFNGKDTKTGFSNKDLNNIKEILKKQKTFLPSSKGKNYTLLPSNIDQYHSQTIKKNVANQLKAINKSLKGASDSLVFLKNGKIITPNSKSGHLVDVDGTIKEYLKKEYNSVIHLNPIYIKPNKVDTTMVKKEEKLLQELLHRTVNYRLQDKIYSLKASEVIKNASLSKKMKYIIDPSGIKNKIAEMNRTQSTLNKNYKFKTHSGKVISVKGKSYGWAIDVNAETQRIVNAFEKGENLIKAYNIYGVGWSTYGVGYHVTSNNGIGDTYAEVSIKDQRIWIYKNSQLKVTSSVVTGWHGVNQDTPKGVWYVQYKKTPSILRGSEVGNPNYSVKVTYWAPFTLDGVGFHDASWRSNWASNAYLTNGSGGCVNIKPEVMKTVYANLVQNEAVIVY
ncbi:L,D-transpeptidase family protein [Bacillus salipaludis]|uniref:L,D-transpeptidase family protein n=1 Tax=Bacillus salipaludis TaxID=2547811 RepID=UPI002E1B860B|nr:L,D-transpeptidase family protein [Bacillus salipaludis]